MVPIEYTVDFHTQPLQSEKNASLFGLVWKIYCRYSLADLTGDWNQAETIHTVELKSRQVFFLDFNGTLSWEKHKMVSAS